MKTTEFYPTPTRFAGGLISDIIVLPPLAAPPEPTTNTLYNIGGVLYWNGNPAGDKTWEKEGGAGPNIYYSAGDVGIGKTSASYPLDVHGVIKTDDAVIMANNKQLQFQDTLGGVTAYVYRDASDNLVLTNASSAKDIQLTTSSGKVAVTGDLSLTGSLKLQETGGLDLMTITAASLGGARTYTVPDAGAAATFIVSTTASPAQGEVIFYNGTSWVSLGVGGDGYYLTTHGASANPTWVPNPYVNISAPSTPLDGRLWWDPDDSSDPGTGSILNVKLLTSGPYTVVTSDQAILCDATLGAFTVNLPAVAGLSGRSIVFKKTDTSVNVVTISGNGTEKIDTTTTYLLEMLDEFVWLVCDGTRWNVTAE